MSAFDHKPLMKRHLNLFAGLLFCVLLTNSVVGGQLPETSDREDDVPDTVVQHAIHSIDLLATAIEGGNRDSVCKWINLPVMVECFADWSKGKTYEDREQLKKDIGDIFGPEFVQQLRSSIKSEQILIEEAGEFSEYRYAFVVGIYTEEYDLEWGTVESARLFRFYYVDGVFKLGLVYCAG